MINKENLFWYLSPQLEKFKDKVFLSAVGARTCYNKEDICYLLEEDERIISNEQRSDFLKRLGFQYYHTSVFSHTFDYFEIKNLNYEILLGILGKRGKILWQKFGDLYNYNETATEILNSIVALIISSNLFKSVYVPDNEVVGLSLRHFVELAENCKECKDKLEDLFRNSDFKLQEITKKYYEDFKNKRINVLPLYISKDYKGWCVFAVQDVSRIMTHQLVRHTKLNFSQRSQRYVFEGDKNEVDYRKFKDLFVVPESIKKIPEIHDKFLDLQFHSYRFYVDAVKSKIPKEDARFGLLEASKTSIIISGTYEDIKDFIEKRNIPQAQWEIRSIAQQMKDILSEFEKSMIK